MARRRRRNPPIDMKKLGIAAGLGVAAYAFASSIEPVENQELDSMRKTISDHPVASGVAATLAMLMYQA